MDAQDSPFISAPEAATRLGIRRASLYSYVSRGLIRTREHSTDPRARLYSASDIEALLVRRERQRRPAEAAASALDWGLPILETHLSDIRDGQLFFRGSNAIDLAETATLEEIAALLWETPNTAFSPKPDRGAVAATGFARPTDRAIGQLAAMLAEEPPGLAGAGLAQRSRRLIWYLAEAAAGERLADKPLHSALAAGWSRPAASDAIRRALVLCADHELNASSFAVRVVASTGASLTNCLITGLAALSGPIHGGMTERVASFLDEVERAGSVDVALSARLGRGETIPGFGHRLYPDGDPRAAALLREVRLSRSITELLKAVEETTGHRPSIDFALVALERAYTLPVGSALAIFAIGRSVGWVAHAMEQRASRQLIRPRARYVR